jgi:hypothetical protein
MNISQTEIVKDRIAGTLAVSTDGHGEIVLGFNVNEISWDSNGFGHVKFSGKQARNLANIFIKHIDIARAESK